MKIGLLDIDGKNFPNLALMKLSAWHKANGDDVEWLDIFAHYNRVYASKVFSNSPDFPYYIDTDELIKGGTGYALHGPGGESYCIEEDKPLPYDIEHIYPDYSIYKINDTAYGFLTRGCPRKCNFCIVSKKEGSRSAKVADLSEFWRGQKKIVLCDPNILACKDWKDLLIQLAESKALIDFNQGLDARLLDEEKCEYLTRVNIKEIHFAWDRYNDGALILKNLKNYSEYSNKPHGHNGIVYVLVNYDTTIEQDLERIYELRDIGYWAYVMIYDKQNASKKLKDLQRWCNNRYVYAACPRFEDYNKIAVDEKQLTFDLNPNF